MMNIYKKMGHLLGEREDRREGGRRKKCKDRKEILHMNTYKERMKKRGERRQGREERREEMKE